MKYVIREHKNPQDATQDAKFYPAPVYDGNITTFDLAKEIAKMCTLTPMDVKACLAAFLEVLPAHLKRGYTVDLNDFARLRLSFHSKGSATADLVDPSKVKGFHIIFSVKPQVQKELQDTPLEVFIDKTTAGWA